MPGRDVITYANMINLYLKHGQLSQAEKIFLQMPRRNVVVYSAMIDGYGKAGEMDKARQLFDEMSARNVFTWTCLVSGYCRAGFIDEARKLFHRMPEKNVVSWTTMFLGYARNGMIAEARELFDQMPEKNVVSWTAMIKAYIENDQIDEARKLFETMPNRNIYSWNIMILGYFECGKTDEASELFRTMPLKNAVSWTTMVTGLAGNGLVNQARSYFDKMPRKDIAAWNAMIKAYLTEGLTTEASNLFELMPEKNIVTWNTMIDGYVKNYSREEAVQLFLLMLHSKVKQNETTMTSMLLGCESIIEVVQIHASAILLGCNCDTSFTNALVSVYSRMGYLVLARLAFEELNLKDVVTWTSMILAYANHGCGDHAVETFGRMLRHGAEPDGITFVGILTACGHSGLVKKGRKIFDSMSKAYGLKPKSEHYSCLVDILGRAGLIEESKMVVSQMPKSECDEAILGSLLGACRVHNEIGMAREVGEELIELHPLGAGGYILLCNTYATGKIWNEVARMHRLMRERKVKKLPGVSQIEVNMKKHVFYVGDRSHPQLIEIYDMLEERLLPQMKLMGSLQGIQSPCIPQKELTEEISCMSDVIDG